MKLNKGKAEIRKSEITFLGHKVTSEGLKIDPEKVDAILQMQMSEDVQLFCWFVNYLAKFLPKLSDVLEPIRKRTCTDVMWNWTIVHDRAFKTVQKLVTEAPVLVYYNSEREVTILCDASQNGLGAVLIQGGQPHCVYQSCYDRHWYSICTDRKGDYGYWNFINTYFVKEWLYHSPCDQKWKQSTRHILELKDASKEPDNAYFGLACLLI